MKLGVSDFDSFYLCVKIGLVILVLIGLGVLYKYKKRETCQLWERNSSGNNFHL